MGPSDEQLVAALQGGDRDSLGHLVARWERPLFQFVYRLVPRVEDASEICQETFLRVLGKADRFEPGAKFSTWMYQIALNLCRDRMRKKRRWSRVIVDWFERRDDRAPPLEAADPSPGPGELAERDERRRVVARALESIPTEQREVLILKEYEGLKFREIAEVLGCPESTVKSRMYYGLNGLRSALVRAGIR